MANAGVPNSEWLGGLSVTMSRDTRHIVAVVWSQLLQDTLLVHISDVGQTWQTTQNATTGYQVRVKCSATCSTLAVTAVIQHQPVVEPEVPTKPDEQVVVHVRLAAGAPFQRSSLRLPVTSGTYLSQIVNMAVSTCNGA
jgi:hypothetical protein